MPVLAGVDAQSTYCYLLAAADHRDADTWGVHLLDATRQGLNRTLTIRLPMPGNGLRAGQKAAWGDTPCHGDVFHIQHQYEGLANTLSRLAKGAASRCQKLRERINRASQRGPDEAFAIQLEQARQTETQAYQLARDIRTLTQWLSHDVLALAGPALATRQELFDFVVEELAQREPEDVRRIRPLRVALQNQRDDLLAFAGVLDKKLAHIARTHEIGEDLVREACVLHRLPAPRPRIGRAGTSFVRRRAASSIRCSTPSAGSWRKHRAAVRWSRTSTRGCAPTSRCAATWAIRTSTCCGSSSTIGASCAAGAPSATAKAPAK
jgi:hypothetical protein